MKIYDTFLLIVSEYSSQPAAHQVLNSMVKEAVLKDISARPQENITPTILPLHLNLSHQDLGGSWPWLLRQHKCQSRDFTQWEHPAAYEDALQQFLAELAYN